MIQRDKQGRFLKGHEVPKEVRKKLSLSLRGICLTKEHKRKISDNHRHYQSKETRIKLSLAHKGKKKSEEHIRNMSLANKGKHHSPETEFKKGCLSPMFRKKHKQVSIEKMRVSHKKTYEGGFVVWNKNKKNCFSINTINQMSEIHKKKWDKKDYRDKQIKLILNGLMKRPTSFEKKISDLCIENSLPFVYTGNGQFLINFKNPDFVNEKEKVVIEVFYSYFKIRDYGSVENYKEFCRKKYEPAGWKVIFIDENELDVDNWKEVCLNNIKKVKEKVRIKV